MSNISAIVAGTTFVALAASNVVIMLEASQPSRSPAARSRLIAAHRAGGYLFVTLFCTMVYGMTQRLAGVGITGHLPTYLVLHIVLVLFLIPLLLLKILIVRRYGQSQSALKALGIAIFVIAFVVVAIPTMSELLRSANPGSVWSRLVSGLIVSVCLAQFGLVFKKSKHTRPASPRFAQCSSQSVQFVHFENASGRMNLLLVQIEPQTHDTKTLRFQVPRDKAFRPRPGQFLTFKWIIDGQRVVRSYTICSSPKYEDYVEITPKRTENGLASVFLNERAKPGLMVEASGPYGHFCFDEKTHKNIILIAAGSGITPMISILRYIDDFELPIRVSLLYCVRTSADIIFQNELVRLEHALPDFNYQVCLSRPHPEWAGASGHLAAELISQHIMDVSSSTFFLCGPKGFMDNAQNILLSLGASEDQILRESFGEAPAESTALDTSQSETVVFINSQRTCQASIASTLLDVAERNGVQIPYSCRQGQCGTCATRVLSGAVQMDVEEGLTAAQKNAGYVLPCVSHAKGTVVLAV
jgi:ring-1,2-phenylacetyl-CoA epoxidase subunit PaaE